MCGESVAVSLASPQVAGVESIAPVGEQDGGQGRIRTFEGVSQQIYSLPRLTTSVPTLKVRGGGDMPGTSYAQA